MSSRQFAISPGRMGCTTESGPGWCVNTDRSLTQSHLITADRRAVVDSTAHRIPRSRYLATREGLIIAPSGRPLKPWAGDRTGHLRVDIDLGRHFVHRLVMETFVGPCPCGMEVRHLNGEPADNRLENLAYGTRSENVLDSVAHGTYRNANSAKTHCPRGHEYVDSNVYIDPSGSRRCRACKAGER